MRIACVQANVAFGEFGANETTALRHMHHVRQAGADLAVFPEAFLTGYVVSSAEQAREIAIERRDLSTLRTAAEDLGLTVIVGFAERDGDTLYNSCALLEPGEGPRWYRKVHLPELGLDKHVEPGSSLPVFETRHGRIGIVICFDLRPPEACRVLTLKGADLIVLPTNWPEGAETSADHIAPTRAAENHVFLATCNRIGKENGFTFIGRSGIYGVTGETLAQAGDEAEILTADLELAQARDKRRVVIPGLYETAILGCRRPELYGEISGHESDEPVGTW